MKEARVQAEGEVLAIFHISNDGVKPFAQMDISETGKSNAILLAVSAIMQADNSVGDLGSLISVIANDIASDGILDSQTALDEISNNTAFITPIQSDVRTNLETFYLSRGLTAVIPEFEDYCDDDGDTIINKYDFVIEFIDVVNADLNKEYISNEVAIILPPEIPEATATITNGVLLVNDVESGQSAAVVNGDVLKIKYTTTLVYGEGFDSELSLVYSTGLENEAFQIFIILPTEVKFILK